MNETGNNTQSHESAATINTIILVGASGRMGQAVIDCVNDWRKVPDQNDRPQTPYNTPHHNWSVGLEITRDLEPLRDFTPSNAAANIIIDFSNAAMTNMLSHQMIGKTIPMLICTTGLTDETRAALQQCSATCAVMIAPNTSTGIMVLHKLLKVATQMLDSSFDIDIVETHHRHKIDAPSGTALDLKKTIENTSSKTPAIGTPAIGMHSLRAGDVVTEHVVSYRGNFETVTLSHSSHSRQVFAEGALRLAAWLIHQKPGLYEPADCV